MWIDAPYSCGILVAEVQHLKHGISRLEELMTDPTDKESLPDWLSVDLKTLIWTKGLWGTFGPTLPAPRAILNADASAEDVLGLTQWMFPFFRELFIGRAASEVKSSGQVIHRPIREGLWVRGRSKVMTFDVHSSGRFRIGFAFEFFDRKNIKPRLTVFYDVLCAPR